MLNKVLEGVSTIAIGGHVRPDGDCVGSCVGLGQYIRENYSDKTVDIYLKDIPESFHFLKGTETILESVADEEKEYDLFIALDCGDTGRLDYSKPLLDHAKHTFCVDHHISNIGFADVNHIVAEASSTSELVYGLLDEEKISKNVAEALYLGIVHDTGVFQYSCAGPETFRVAAKLLEKEINGPKIIEDTFYAKSYAQNQVMGRALMESILFLNGVGIASFIRKNVMDFYGVVPKDLEGIVSQLRVTEGVEVAVFMYELKQNEFKVSLRSKSELDVSKIAQYFGGGGHKKAAGFTMAGTPFDVLNNLSEQIEEQLEKLEKTQEQ
nr:DHH family phosphoesterase [uncultured Dorea sp.]